LLIAGLAAVTVATASPAAAAIGNCETAPQRVFQVAAINVEITVNRHGDNDPFGFMYVLQNRIAAVRQFEAKPRVASQTADELDGNGNLVRTWPELVAENPNATLVSNGLGQDPIQPLVLRARVGECVTILMRNDLTRGPVGGNSNANAFEFPGGVPRVVSISRCK
jgi:hypothetical protein